MRGQATQLVINQREKFVCGLSAPWSMAVKMRVISVILYLYIQAGEATGRARLCATFGKKRRIGQCSSAPSSMHPNASCPDRKLKRTNNFSSPDTIQDLAVGQGAW